MEFSDNQDRIFVFRLLFCIFIIVKAIKVRFTLDLHPRTTDKIERINL